MSANLIKKDPGKQMRELRKPGVVVVTVPDWPDAWSGWRFSGGALVSPEGDRVTPERLRGLLWRQAQEARAAAWRARKERVCKVHDGLRQRVSSLSQQAAETPPGSG